MNNFYATVECFLDPSLRDKRVAVGGSVEDRHGIILAKNEAAKAFGVKTGEAIWQAKQKCKGLIIVPPHYDEYKKFSALAREIYGRYTDQVEPYGLDECWLDVTGSGLFGTGPEIAEEIRETIKRELGLTISVGVSFNKVFAKLGSDMKKPDAVTIITRAEFKQKVWPLPASELLGVGKATKKTLEECGIVTIGDLAAASETLMHLRFGKNGLQLKKYAMGEDDGTVAKIGQYSEVKSIGHGSTTKVDLTTSEEVWRVMLELVQDIGTQLRRANKKAGGIAISIRNNLMQTKEWQCKLDYATQSATTLAKSAHRLFEDSYEWQRPIRSVSVRAIDLLDENFPVQYDMFTDIDGIERQERLDTAVESIRERFGKHSIKNGVLYSDIKMSNGPPADVGFPGSRKNGEKPK